MIDITFKNLLKYKKYKDVYDIKSLEVIVSFITAITMVLFIIATFKYIDLEDFNTIIRTLSQGISITLIGFIGFIVTGLAILTSAISNKLMNIIHKKKQTENIEKILISFYFLGLVVGISIIFWIYSIFSIIYTYRC